jgi:hypothetical protein
MTTRDTSIFVIELYPDVRHRDQIRKEGKKEVNNERTNKRRKERRKERRKLINNQSIRKSKKRIGNEGAQLASV